MSKKLTKHGNSLALVIDKPLLEALKINQNTDLEISIDKGKLIIQPKEKTKKSLTEKDIDKIAEKIMKKYAPVLKKLADS
jgi:putative addiction module antidote